MGNNGSPTPPIAVEVVERVADVMGMSELEAPPLSDRVDTDALEALVSYEETTGGDVTIQFEYQDHLVEVDSNREIEIY
jgi:hypothetical protein